MMRRSLARAGVVSGVAALSLAATTSMGGCVRRTIAISSAPSDALVYVNDREVGRTPCEIQFTYYGEYDVRLKLEGYESVVGSGVASAPFWDFIGADLVSELAPVDLESRVEWHFDLAKADKSPETLLARARSLRVVVEGTGPAAKSPDDGAKTALPPQTFDPVGEGALPPTGSAEVPVPPTELPADTPGRAP